VTRNLAQTAFHPFLSGGGGDVHAARECAQALLSGREGSPARLGAARLILTAVCLHLYPVVGPDPTLADLHAFLASLGRPDPSAWDALALSPLALVQYVSADFNSGRGKGPQAAISLAIQAVTAKMHTNV
jgi:hypothetical protein